MNIENLELPVFELNGKNYYATSMTFAEVDTDKLTLVFPPNTFPDDIQNIKVEIDEN